jgi:hypothetical protein
MDREEAQDCMSLGLRDTMGDSSPERLAVPNVVRCCDGTRKKDLEEIQCPRNGLRRCANG